MCIIILSRQVYICIVVRRRQCTFIRLYIYCKRPLNVLNSELLIKASVVISLASVHCSARITRYEFNTDSHIHILALNHYTIIMTEQKQRREKNIQTKQKKVFLLWVTVVEWCVDIFICKHRLYKKNTSIHFCVYIHTSYFEH